MNAENLFEMSEYINDFGKKEFYVRKEILKTYTGHINSGSGTSSSSDCGNCDGARCGSCKEVFDVMLYSMPFYNPEWFCNETKTLKARRFYNLKDAVAFYSTL